MRDGNIIIEFEPVKFCIGINLPDSVECKVSVYKIAEMDQCQYGKGSDQHSFQFSGHGMMLKWYLSLIHI